MKPIDLGSSLAEETNWSQAHLKHRAHGVNKVIETPLLVYPYQALKRLISYGHFSRFRLELAWASPIHTHASPKTHGVVAWRKARC